MRSGTYSVSTTDHLSSYLERLAQGSTPPNAVEATYVDVQNGEDRRDQQKHQGHEIRSLSKSVFVLLDRRMLPIIVRYSYFWISVWHGDYP